MEVCRLCLDLLQEKTFLRLGDAYKCIINSVVPEADLDITSDPVVCNLCSNSVGELHKFKILCFENQQQLKLKAKVLTDSKLTVKEILHGPGMNKVVITDKTKERYCRTCLESIESESFTILKPSSPDAYLDSMLRMCLPEVDLQLTRDPVMCEKCLSYLQKLHHLRSTCLDVEEKLKNYSLNHGTNAQSPFKLLSVLELVQDSNKNRPEFISLTEMKSEKTVDDSAINHKEVGKQNDSRTVIGEEEMDLKLEEEIHSSEDEKSLAKREPNKLDKIMKEIMKNHKQETHYSCSLCAFTMANKRHYVMHMLTTHTTFNEETRLMHLCHLCDYKTMYKDQMKKHIENDHMEKEKLHCPFCSFTSIYTLNLRRHISIHEDMQDLVCSHPQCDFKTSYKYSLQRHEIKIHGNQCSVCHYKNRNRSAVQKHLRTVHGIYEIHHCDKCKFKTFYLMTLKRHNAREHKGMMKTNFTSVKKRKDELTAEEEEEIKNLFKD